MSDTHHSDHSDHSDFSDDADDVANVPNDPDRRRLIGMAGAAAILGFVGQAFGASRLPPSSQARAQGSAPGAASTQGPRGPLGARLRGVQHFGITVQNMDRAFEFYTQVLGGTEIMRDGDFQGDKIHNTLLTYEEIEAARTKVNPRTIGVPDLRGGAQRLDVRFIQFDNVVIELLQYRDQQQPAGSGASFAAPRELTSPAYPRSMHVCFYVRDDVDFNQFIHDLEAESARRGMTNVKANRIIRASTEDQRTGAPLDTLTLKISEGQSNGWSLIYCKGPEGEQLEFVQVLGQVKSTFDNAYESRRRTGSR